MGSSPIYAAKVTIYSQKQTFFGEYFALSASLIIFADEIIYDTNAKVTF